MDNIVVWTGIQCRRAIVRATIDEANCPLTQSVDHASLRLCPVLLRCHTENTAVHVPSLCVLMQTTLFGKVKRKEPFFTNVGANTASAYYTTVESLWQLSSVTDRKHFLKAAQQQWTQTYRDDHDAREALLAQAKTRTLETTTILYPRSLKQSRVKKRYIAGRKNAWHRRRNLKRRVTPQKAVGLHSMQC